MMLFMRTVMNRHILQGAKSVTLIAAVATLIWSLSSLTDNSAAEPRSSASAAQAVKTVVADIGSGRTHKLYALLVPVQRSKVSYSKFARCATYVGRGQHVTRVGAVVRQPLKVSGYGSRLAGALVGVTVKFRSGRVTKGRAAVVYRNGHWNWFLTASQLKSCQ